MDSPSKKTSGDPPRRMAASPSKKMVSGEGEEIYLWRKIYGLFQKMVLQWWLIFINKNISKSPVAQPAERVAVNH